MKSITKYYRVEHNNIYFLKFILEAYDGIAVISTVDRNLGIVSIHMSPGCEEDVYMVINTLKKDIMIEDLNDNILL